MFDPTKISKEFVGLLLQAEPRIYAYIRMQIYSRADADDVFQETVMALWASYPDFDPTRNFLAWAYGFAKNKVLHHQRSQTRRRLIFSDDAIQQIAVEAEAMDGELGNLQTALRGCLTKLRAADRDIVQQCYGTGMTVASVSAHLGRPVNTIKAILKRSRRALYDCVRRTLAREEHE